MKTLSVKQVADVLGVSPRAVLKRLSNGQLKGTRRTNKYGVEEWWVYPNKEIRSTAAASGRIDILGGNEALSDAEIVDVDTQNFAPNDVVFDEEVDEPHSTDSNPGAGAYNARGAASGVAEELWNNIISRFLGELKERDQLIGEMRNELADKDRQLKLLPDFQKQAEERRQEAEVKELEAIALAKQIDAMQALAHEKAADLARLGQLETDTLPSLKRQLEAERFQKDKEVAEATAKFIALENAMQESEMASFKLEETLQGEIARLRDEKEDQAKAIETKFDALNQKLEGLQKPWWKKLFTAPPENK